MSGDKPNFLNVHGEPLAVACWLSHPRAWEKCCSFRAVDATRSVRPHCNTGALLLPPAVYSATGLRDTKSLGEWWWAQAPLGLWSRPS